MWDINYQSFFMVVGVVHHCGWLDLHAILCDSHILPQLLILTVHQHSTYVRTYVQILCVHTVHTYVHTVHMYVCIYRVMLVVRANVFIYRLGLS